MVGRLPIGGALYRAETRLGQTLIWSCSRPSLFLLPTPLHLQSTTEDCLHAPTTTTSPPFDDSTPPSPILSCHSHQYLYNLGHALKLSQPPPPTLWPPPTFKTPKLQSPRVLLLTDLLYKARDRKASYYTHYIHLPLDSSLMDLTRRLILYRSDSGYYSPRRHHFRESSNHQEVKVRCTSSSECCRSGNTLLTCRAWLGNTQCTLPIQPR